VVRCDDDVTNTCENCVAPLPRAAETTKLSFVEKRKKIGKLGKKKRETRVRDTERRDTRAHRTGDTATRLLKSAARCV